MLLKAFEIGWTLVFFVMVLMRCLTATAVVFRGVVPVTLEISWDTIALMGLAFGIGMLARESIR